MRPIGQHAGRWTPSRLDIATEALLRHDLSLTKAAKSLGITRAALTNALKRHNQLPKKSWQKKGVAMLPNSLKYIEGDFKYDFEDVPAKVGDQELLCDGAIWVEYSAEKNLDGEWDFNWDFEGFYQLYVCLRSDGHPVAIAPELVHKQIVAVLEQNDTTISEKAFEHATDSFR